MFSKLWFYDSSIAQKPENRICKNKKWLFSPMAECAKMKKRLPCRQQKGVNSRMSKKPKMTRDIVPEGFTLTLALVDALPVLFFCATMLAVGRLFASSLFLAGALLCFAAGAAKVLWKVIVVLQKKNIWFLFLQMRILMPIGFVLMLISLAVNRSQISLAGMGAAVVRMPSCIFFALGILGMVLMVVFAVKLDSSDVKANWIEQLTNGIAQAAFFVGVMLL